jgi:tungstate transport system substrate-binding protein
MTSCSLLRLQAWPLAILLSLSLFVAACGNDDDDQPAGFIGGDMILATTTSTFDSGLLDALVPLFENQTGVNVKIIAVGTGAALEMGRKGDADVVLAHAPDSEQELIDEGHLIESRLVMHNDFVIVGPPDDPAGVKSAETIDDALRAIAAVGPFISRGDDSGTHKMELALWDDAGIGTSDVALLDETGQGMGATLNVADQKRGYSLTDRGTFLALRHNLELEVLFEGARALLNIYHVHLVNPERHSGVKEPQGRAFVEFLVSNEAQEIIRTFGIEEFGEPLFVPDAGKDINELGH